MKKQLLLLILMFASVWTVQSQQIVADWETPETSQSGNGSWPEGGSLTIIDNPHIAAPNESSTVFEYCKADPSWAGMGLVFRDPTGEAKTGFNVDEEVAQLCLMIRSDHNFALKVTVGDGRDADDQSVRIPPPWEPTSTDSVDAQIALVQNYTSAGEWQELCFDFKSHTDGVASVVEYATIAFTPTEQGTYCYQIDNVTKLPETSGGGVTQEPKSGVVLWDMESTIPVATKSWSNKTFGSDTFGIVNNPKVVGNTSSKVWKWCKAKDASKFAAMNFAEGLDFTGTSYTICMDVLMPKNGEVGLKINDAIIDGDTITSLDITDLIEPYTGNGEWQQICFNGQQGDRHGDVVAGLKFASFNIYMDINNVPTEDACHYFDNITIVDGPIDVISDWETEATSKDKDAYGNQTSAEVVDNPSPDAINSTSKTYKLCKSFSSDAWAGFGIEIDTFDTTGDDATLCVSIYSTVNSKVKVTLLEATDGSTDFGLVQDYTNAGEWQVLCYDMIPAGKHLYGAMVIQPDNGNVPTEETCFYVDEVKKRTDGEGIILELANDLISKNSDYSMFAGFIAAADVSEAINTGGISIFAPSNTAFSALSADDLAALNNNTNNALVNMIFHHITFDSLSGDDLAGTHIMRNGQDGVIEASAINGAAISSTEQAKNGFVHFLDGVMEAPSNPDFFMLQEFEGNDDANERDWWHWGTPGNIVSHTIVDNPAPGGVNTSSKVLQYKKYPVGLWYQGIAVLPARAFNFFGPMTRVCMDVKSENDGEIFLKIDKAPGTGAKTGFRKTFTGGEWNSICWNVDEDSYYYKEGDDKLPQNALNQLYTGPALFFDTENKEFPADTVSYFIDNLRVINTAVGVNEIAKLENFSMFPNPTSDVLTIQTNTPVNHIEIYDITGRMVRSIINPINTEINVSSLSEGIYLVDFFGENNQRLGTAKFVKQ